MPSSADPNAVDSDAETLEEGGDPMPSSSGESREATTGAINPSWEGETLALDDPYAETQVVEDWLDTQVVPDHEEEEEEEGRSERTEVLSDGCGEDDEVASRVFEDRSGGGERGDDETPECEASAPVSGSGSARSFSSVRAASLQASGRAAICKVTTTCPLFEQSSVLLNSNLNKEHKSDIGGKPRTEDEKIVSAVDIVSSNGGAVADKLLNDEITEPGNFKHCEREGLSQKNGNGVARCLFQEDFHIHLDEYQTKGGIKGDKDLSQLPDNPIAGLSYIGSQEPGEFSQANAIEVVDRLLYLTDLGVSEDASIEENVMVPSPASTGVKGVKRLAKAACNSPVGKEEAFDWNDAYEDEGGGDFFVKRKSLFFGDEDSKKSQSLPPKSRHSHERESDKSVYNGKKKDAPSPKSLSKLRRSGFSDSVQQRPMSIGGGNDTIPKKGRSKTILKDTKKKLNLDFAGNLEEDNFGTEMTSFHDVGPDTQMAAEAMEALVSAIPEELSPVRFIQTTGASTDHQEQSACPNKEHSKDTVKKKRSSLIFGSDVTIRRSKRLGKSSAWFNSGTETIGKDGEKLLERNTSARDAERKYMKGKPESEERVLSKDPINKRKCINGDSLSTSRGKHKKGQNHELARKKTKINNLNKKNGIEPKADKSLSSTPISYRTRNSIAGKSRKLVDLSHIDIDRVSGKNAATNAVTGSVNLKSSETTPNLSRDVRCSETRQKDTLSGQINNAKVPCQQTGSTVAAVPFHPKRRRTCMSRKVTSSSDLSLQNNQTTMEDNFVADKLGNDESKRGQVDCLHSMCSSRSKAFVADVGEKPSSYLDRLNAIPQQSTSLQTYEDVSACDGSSVPGDGQRTLKYSDLSSCGKNTSLNVVRIGSPASDLPQKRKNHPSNMVHISSPKRVVEGSPICTANVPSKMVHKDACKPSIARELIRLVSSNMTEIPVLKDSQRKEMSSVCALFSRHLEEKVVKHLGKITKRLGISVASSISDATHFIADKFVRTRNLLEAMAVGKPVVTPMWLKKCGELSSLVDEKSYLLRDLEKEKEIGFSMPVSLARSSQCPLLEGKRIFLTPNVKPDRKTVSSLIKAAGGQPVERIGRSTINDDKVLDGLLIISCEEDYATCASLLKKGAEIFSSELLLNGIVIQRLEYDRHRLFLDHVKQTRSTLWLKNEGSDQFHPVARRK